MALAQKFDVVSESHQFSYKFLILSRDMSHNACRQTYVLDSRDGRNKEMRDRDRDMMIKRK